GQRPKQYQLEKLVIGDRIAAGLTKTRAQALAMAVIMRRRFCDASLATATIFRHDRPAVCPTYPHPQAREGGGSMRKPRLACNPRLWAGKAEVRRFDTAAGRSPSATT